MVNLILEFWDGWSGPSDIRYPQEGKTAEQNPDRRLRSAVVLKRWWAKGEGHVDSCGVNSGDEVTGEALVSVVGG